MRRKALRYSHLTFPPNFVTQPVWAVDELYMTGKYPEIRHARHVEGTTLVFMERKPLI
jgi:hypothetical protein